MIRKLLIPFFLLLSLQAVFAQSTSGKVVDSKTGESIPYANIRLNNSENLITNAEGAFTVSENNSGDDTIIVVSFLGYSDSQLTVAELKNRQGIIKLEPGVFELDSVDVAKNPDPNEIMVQVKKNLANNYNGSGQPVKNTLFFREANSFKPEQLKVEIEKSTGFTKEQLAKANGQLNAFTSQLFTHPPKEFTDKLCNYYTETKPGSKLPYTKLEVVKATRLKDENRSASLDEMQDAATKILLQHLDSTKYYRIKSGLFGSRDTLSLRKDFNKKKNKAEPNQTVSSKLGLMSFLSQNSFLAGSKLDFVTQPEIYDYTYDGATFNKDELVYILKFKPRKSRAKYTGTLYITQTDFAVVRADYTLEEGETLSGINLKFFLGIKQSENVSKGTLIYKQNADEKGYYLQYASMESGQYIYVNRPLKFIELTHEDKDVVAFDIKLEVNTLNKKEFLNMSKIEVASDAFDKIKEEDFGYIRLKRYDPKIWKDYSAIEPLEEMKQFNAAD
jgi:hypothetical protein